MKEQKIGCPAVFGLLPVTKPFSDFLEIQFKRSLGKIIRES